MFSSAPGQKHCCCDLVLLVCVQEPFLCANHFSVLFFHFTYLDYVLQKRFPEVYANTENLGFKN